MGVSPNTEPGTGTQVYAFATEPDDDRRPNVYTIDGHTWAVGREYWDARFRDLVTLVRVVGRSSWCDTREPEDCPPKLIFERDPSPGVYNSHFRVDPIPTPDPDETTAAERFTLRATPDPAGCKDEVWPGASR